MPVTKTPILKILSDLGIDLMDVDNDEDYLRALMEGVNQLTLIDPKHRDIPTLQKEFKRVRGSRKAAAPSPGMQATKKKISGASIKRGGALAAADKTSQIVTQPVVQQTTVVSGGKEGDSSSPQFHSNLIKILKGILDNVNGMLAVLASRQVFETKKAKRDRKISEKAKRNAREAKIEQNNRFEGIKKAGIKAMQPAINLWGKLWDFLTTIFLGRAALQLWKWFNDPENQAKFSRLAERFKEWWPKFIEGTKEFFGQVVDFSKWVVENIGDWTTTLLTVTIPALTAALVGMGPFGIAGAATAGFAGGKIWNAVTGENTDGDRVSPTPTDRFSPTQGETQGNNQTSSKVDPLKVLEKNRDLIPLGMYGMVRNKINEDPSAYDTKEEIEAALSRYNIDPRKVKYATGGFVSGPGGVDRVPAKLTAGEFVMTKGAVDQWGADTLAAMNAAAGGKNTGSLSGGFKEGGRVDAHPEKKGSTKGNPDFWTLVAIASREDGDPQGRADVAQSIYNRALSGAYGGGERRIRKLITANGQYEPTWQYPKNEPCIKNTPNPSWHKIVDARTAGIAAGLSEGVMKSVAQQLLNPTYQENARKWVEGRTDFQGGSNRPGPNDIRRNPNDNFFGWHWNYKKNQIAAVPNWSVSGTQVKPLPGSSKLETDASGGAGDTGGSGSTSKDKDKDKLNNPVFKKVFEAFGGTEIFKNLQKGMEGIENLRKEMFKGMDYDDLILKGQGDKRTIPPPPPVPKPVVTLDGQTGNEAFQQGAAPNSNMSLPSLDASAMISGKKIATLGISV